MSQRVILLTWVVWVCGWAFPGVAGATDPSLVGWWKLDETSGTTAVDSSGNGKNGTLVGGPVWVTGASAGALRFDGSNDYVRIANSPDFNISQQITLAAWIKVNGFDRLWQAIICRGDYSWRLQRDAGTDHLEFACTGVQVPFTTWGNVLGQVNVNDGNWHHAAGVYDGAEVRLYIDGTLDTSVYGSGMINASIYDVLIGENAEQTQRFWNGLIDDVRVYRRALTREEILGVMRGAEDVFLASNPQPADRSTVDVGAAAVLSWSPREDMIGYDVYFGSDRDKVDQASTRVGGIYRGQQTATTYHLSDALVMGRSYYWRIDEVDQFGQTHKGTVWSFTVANYLVVDGFEPYDDACNRIFYTWLDGVGHTGSTVCGKAPFAGNGTGSMVDQATAPEGTRTVVHSGVQSLQLTYDNSIKPYYSQTERTFSPLQDWTRYDVNTLTVYVRGDPANKPDTLYLEVGDSAQHSKRISHPEPQIVAKGYWRGWDIALREFAAGGVDLKRVKRLVIGVGDRTAPKAGGQGKVYVDDIRRAKGGSALRPVAYWEFEEGTGTTASDSAGSHDGTVNGALWVPGKIGTALWFDGFDDYVDCGTDSLLNPAEMTLTLWVCPETKYAMTRSLVAKVGSGEYEADYSVQLGMMGEVKGWFGNGNASVVVAGARNVVSGEWTHLALTRDGSELALYLDGGNRTSVGYSLEPGDGGYLLQIGGPSSYKGKIDDARLYDRALAPEEIEQIAGGQL